MEPNNTIIFAGGYSGMSPDLFSKWVDLNIAYQKSNLFTMPPISRFQNVDPLDQIPLPLEDEKKQESENS
jgi:hypothetical protein